MSKLRKTKNNKLILVLPMVLVICFGVLLTYSFANFKSIKLFDAVGGFFLGNEYTLSYDVANCTNKTIKNGKTFGELCVPAIPDGYTFEGWYYNDELIETTTQVHTNQNIQLLAHFTQNNSCVIGTTYDFDYTGDVQQFTASCPGQYKVELWGAKGIEDNSASIRYGAYTSGQITLSSNQKLYVYVGQVGSYNSGGYNGGGSGRLNEKLYYKWGGGATDIRYFGSTTPSSSDLVWNSDLGLNSRIMVAGGGGGAYTGNASSSASNSNAGGLTGYNGTYNSSYSSYLARGGSQTAGGTVTNYGSSFSAGTTGAFGQGGTGGGANTSSVGNKTGSYGGGGGYYGGGGGSRWAAATTGGAGGSSYISGHAGSIAIAEGATNNPRTIKTGCTSSSTSVDCSKHYSGLFFTNTVMIDGSGYNWTTTKGSLVNQPQPDGTTTTGHNGNGYARITYLGNTTEFAYTGNYQEFTAPMDGIYQVELWGASGGGVNETYYGGRGAYTSGTISLAADTQLYFYIGGQGGSGSSSLAGGYNGGAASKTYAQYTMTTGSGGGATDVRYFESTPSSSDLTWNSINGLNSRIMVAAGGGGADYTQSSSTFYFNGGSGGGLTGYQGGTVSYCNHTNCTVSGLGGTQTSPGGNEYSSSFTITAEFGKGGTPYDTSSSTGAGGGSGYYGGGGGSWASGSGGGGSSYISGYLGSLAIAKESNSNPRALKIGCTSSSRSVECATHYSGLYFENSVMIDGKGCNWSTGSAANCGTNQPQPDGTNDVGHSGNGYARITYLGTTLPSNLITTLNSSSIIVSSNDDPSNSANNVFDNDDSTLWTARTKTNEYIGYHFDNPVRVVKLVLKPSNTAGYARVKNFRIEASNDNSTWTTLYTGLYDNQTESIKKEYNISNNSYYSYYRIYVIDNHATQTNMYVRIDTLEFYGYN